MDEITKEYVEEAMKVVTTREGVDSEKDFDNGRILIRFYAAGSRDTMFVFCENLQVAAISSKDWKSIWTKSVTDPEHMNTKLGKALVTELAKDFSINWWSAK